MTERRRKIHVLGQQPKPVVKADPAPIVNPGSDPNKATNEKIVDTNGHEKPKYPGPRIFRE